MKYLNDNFDDFKNKTEGQIITYMIWYRSEQNQTWEYIFENLDIEPEYLEPNKYLSYAYEQKKNKALALNLNKGLKQAKSTLSHVSKCKIDDGLILKPISSVSVVNICKRKYNVPINYNFKNQIIGA